MKWVTYVSLLVCLLSSQAAALRATRPIIAPKKIAKPTELKPRQQYRLCHSQNTQAECQKHPCLWCQSTAVPSGCFSPIELYRLPKTVYECTGDRAVMEAAQQKQKKLAADPCEGKDQQSCDALDECTWCKSAAVPSSCYTRAQAKFLPPAVFVCDKPSPSLQRKERRKAGKAAGSAGEAADRARRRAGSATRSVVPTA